MRENIVHADADSLVYEIRQIVGLAQKIEEFGIKIVYENIGDPVHKGEKIAPWIKDIVANLVQEDKSWGYAPSQGEKKTREFLAQEVNKRGGAQITENDIYFFSGLGDAITKVFGFLRREARILGPSPAYSTLGTAESVHSGYEHFTYELLPEKNWMPDVQDIENKIKYNDSIVGILLINPDNPTGAVYDTTTLKQIIDICERYDCMVICDETYANINYSPAGRIHLSEVIGTKVVGIALRSISKEFPWPGGRCGWIEVFNRKNDAVFERYIKTLLDAKMLEVSSTTLPQMSIPLVCGDSRYIPHLQARNKMFKERAGLAVSYLKNVRGIKVIEPQGAFYVTVVFDDDMLDSRMSLPIENKALAEFLLPHLQKSATADRRFILYLMANTGICVVPLTSFGSRRNGFRITLLENNMEKFTWVYKTIAHAVEQYLASV